MFVCLQLPKTRRRSCWTIGAATLEREAADRQVRLLRVYVRTQTSMLCVCVRACVYVSDVVARVRALEHDLERARQDRAASEEQMRYQLAALLVRCLFICLSCSSL